MALNPDIPDCLIVGGPCLATAYRTLTQKEEPFYPYPEADYPDIIPEDQFMHGVARSMLVTRAVCPALRKLSPDGPPVTAASYATDPGLDIHAKLANPSELDFREARALRGLRANCGFSDLKDTN